VLLISISKTWSEVAAATAEPIHTIAGLRALDRELGERTGQLKQLVSGVGIMWITCGLYSSAGELAAGLRALDRELGERTGQLKQLVSGVCLICGWLAV
jgi:hypothetical protein